MTDSCSTVVGVLVEVPGMLAAVGVVNRTRGWYERRAGVMPHEDAARPRRTSMRHAVPRVAWAATISRPADAVITQRSDRLASGE